MQKKKLEEPQISTLRQCGWRYCSQSLDKQDEFCFPLFFIIVFWLIFYLYKSFPHFDVAICHINWSRILVNAWTATTLQEMWVYHTTAILLVQFDFYWIVRAHTLQLSLATCLLDQLPTKIVWSTSKLVQLRGILEHRWTVFIWHFCIPNVFNILLLLLLLARSMNRDFNLKILLAV